jgi:hypothetical protein
MGFITSTSKNHFVSADEIYNKILRDLSSFSGTNVLDVAEFPYYTFELLGRLGISSLEESEAIVKINDHFVGDLPFDFCELYAAYKCTPSFGPHDNIYPQQIVKMWMDVDMSCYRKTKDCEINCCAENEQLIQKIEMRTYLGGDGMTFNFINPILLRLSPNVRADKCHSHCKNLLYSSPYEITLTDHSIITNFKNDCVYMQYYAFPYDEYNNPMIPDIPEVKKAIEWWIKYNIFLNSVFNQNIPDVANKYKLAEEQYEKWYAEAKYILKLPTFSTLVNFIRNKRSINKVSFFSSMDYKSGRHYSTRLI